MEIENLMLVNEFEVERKKNEELNMNRKNYSDNVSLSEELRITDTHANKFDCILCGETFGVRRISRHIEVKITKKKLESIS